MASYRERIIRKAATLIGSLLITGSVLATSAYAWFASSNQVSVTGMQISAKDDSSGIGFSLYYYNGNFDGAAYYANPTAAPHGYLSATGFTGTFLENFTKVTGLNNYQTTSAGLYPGRKLTYALVLTNGSDEKNVSIDIEDFSSPFGSAYYTTEEVVEGVPQEVEKPILLSYAIDIHCDYCPAASLSANDFDNLAAYMTNEYFPALNHTSQYVNSAAKDMFNVSTANPGTISLVEGVPVGATEVYVFFTVIFSDDPSTYYSFVRTVDTKNYYEADPVDGNSNCYMTLQFQITDMAVN